MKTRIASSLLALALVAGAPLALAEGPAAPPAGAGGGPGPMMGKGAMMGERQGPGMGPHRQMRQGKPESFTEETVRKMADGRVFKQSVEQKVGEGSLYRKEVFTNPQGKTATRTMTATLSKDGKTWTRRVEGVDFDGQTWSRSRELPVHQGPEAEDDDDRAAGKAAPAKAPAGKKGG